MGLTVRLGEGILAGAHRIGAWRTAAREGAAMQEKDVIRWGVIGCGDVVETKNGPGLYLAEGSELVGIWNRTEQKAVDWCARHGHGRAFDSLDELLADPSIDIVYVATTPNCHKDHAIAVANAGKNCYLEKPIALTWGEAQEIKAAFQAAGKRCFVAHYRRGMPRYRELKRLLDSGKIGTVRGIQVVRTQRQTAEERLPESQKPWRVRPEVSGGSHFFEGDAHMLDLIAFLAGGPIADFSLKVDNRTGCYPGEDTVALSGETASHVMVSGIWCYATYKAIDRFLVYGDKGSAEFSYYDNAAPIRVETLANPAAVAHEGVMGGVRKEADLVVEELCPPVESYPGNGQIQDIVNELRGVPDAVCSSTLDNALNTLRITWAAHELRAQQLANQ